ncbi:MAG: hypothetical protein M1831_003924 [Alyxoria varia]|nr:MAG: hypothetical protein M1831_003924 [Alyxoria varia]
MPHPPPVREAEDHDVGYRHYQNTVWDKLSFAKLGKARKRSFDSDSAKPLARRNTAQAPSKEPPRSSKSSRSIIARLPASFIPKRKASRDGQAQGEDEVNRAYRRTRSASFDNLKDPASRRDFLTLGTSQYTSNSASQIPSSGAENTHQGAFNSVANGTTFAGGAIAGGSGRSESLSSTRSSSRSRAPRDIISDPQFREELSSRWILNLTMASEQRVEREKFFITYAEHLNKWRRVTVSCDYTDASDGSLEAELKSLHYQGDKSARIYEAIRESLETVKFYDTVTHLSLRTEDGQLHVHVKEDMNEIIKYPPMSAVGHLHCKTVPETDIHFDSHMSGFVYKVRIDGQAFIKKEIPGRDMVDEFLYEVNALVSLSESTDVIDFEAIVVEENEEGIFIKGLLISYAKRGALADLLYDYRDAPLTWSLREKWAKQIVSGLKDIHEAGFVQGDFTLANVVVDEEDNAKIIDINRRGCPVGWEPPEFEGIITSCQRPSMYIGVKSDLYQLGMVLWGLAANCDVPELQVDPLTLDQEGSEPPSYLRRMVATCLERKPKQRRSAKDLLTWFPDDRHVTAPLPAQMRSFSPFSHHSAPEYIDPAAAMELNDVEHIKRENSSFSLGGESYEETTYAGWTEGTGQYIDSVQSSAPVDVTLEETILDSQSKLCANYPSSAPQAASEECLRSREGINIDQSKEAEHHDDSSRPETMSLQHLQNAHVGFGSLPHQDSGLGDDMLGPTSHFPGLPPDLTEDRPDQRHSPRSSHARSPIPPELAGLGAGLR